MWRVLSLLLTLYCFLSFHQLSFPIKKSASQCVNDPDWKVDALNEYLEPIINLFVISIGLSGCNSADRSACVWPSNNVSLVPPWIWSFAVTAPKPSHIQPLKHPITTCKANSSPATRSHLDLQLKPSYMSWFISKSIINLPWSVQWWWRI